MKKAIAILISAMLLVSMLSLTSFAAEDSEMVPVVVSVPEGWEAPNLWAWGDDGTNAFAAWPGEALEPLAEGWYYTYVPGFVQNVIVNASQGTDNAVQTDAVAVEAGKEVWITVAEDLTATVSYEAQLRGEIPAYVEKFNVHAYVPLSWKTVNMWAWSAPDGTNAFASWPGEALTRDGDWYTIEVPGWINSVIINANGGTVQTSDLSVEAGKDVWVVVTDAENAAVSYEEPAAQAAPTETEPPETEAPATEPAPVEAEKSNTGLIVGIAAAVAVLGGGAAVLVSRKKKK